MPAQRRFGMDHEHYDWSPISTRGVLRWPEEARLALCVVVNLEHMEWSPPGDAWAAPLPGGWGHRPFTDLARPSHREYGHRVGIFRVLDVLEKHGVKATIAMDALTAEHYPYLVDHCLKRGCEIMGHGISASRMISANMTEQQEREYLETSIEAVKRATGSAPSGWLGPGYGESSRTPQLLAEAGIRYLCDWANDEQPYPFKTGGGELTALPLMLEMDDVVAIWERRVTESRYGELLKQCFDVMYEDGAATGRLMAVNLHPWLIGQPFRIRYLDEALGHMMGAGGVWAATGSDITDWYREHPPAV